jgi:hypothetical protein
MAIASQLLNPKKMPHTKKDRPGPRTSDHIYGLQMTEPAGLTNNNRKRPINDTDLESNPAKRVKISNAQSKTSSENVDDKVIEDTALTPETTDVEMPAYIPTPGQYRKLVLQKYQSLVEDSAFLKHVFDQLRLPITNDIQGRFVDTSAKATKAKRIRTKVVDSKRTRIIAMNKARISDTYAALVSNPRALDETYTEETIAFIQQMKVDFLTSDEFVSIKDQVYKFYLSEISKDADAGSSATSEATEMNLDPSDLVETIQATITAHTSQEEQRALIEIRNEVLNQRQSEQPQIMNVPPHKDANQPGSASMNGNGAAVLSIFDPPVGPSIRTAETLANAQSNGALIQIHSQIDTTIRTIDQEVEDELGSRGPEYTVNGIHGWFKSFAKFFPEGSAPNEIIHRSAVPFNDFLIFIRNMLVNFKNKISQPGAIEALANKLKNILTTLWTKHKKEIIAILAIITALSLLYRYCKAYLSAQANLAKISLVLLEERKQQTADQLNSASMPQIKPPARGRPPKAG